MSFKFLSDLRYFIKVYFFYFYLFVLFSLVFTEDVSFIYFDFIYLFFSFDIHIPIYSKKNLFIL